MTAQAPSSVQRRAAHWTLSVPVQSTLYVSLCTLILWTVYFTTYPPIHDQVHSLRHHTGLVSCH
ncbi:MAG: CbtB-domain containing protein [Thermosynechococcaceae cyanobacterium MS004]|nr:CbtB-domain containing protein [Thermosynechococcaceae cyanobacterium MS004]